MSLTPSPSAQLPQAGAGSLLRAGIAPCLSALLLMLHTEISLETGAVADAALLTPEAASRLHLLAAAP